MLVNACGVIIGLYFCHCQKYMVVCTETAAYRLHLWLDSRRTGIGVPGVCDVVAHAAGTDSGRNCSYVGVISEQGAGFGCACSGVDGGQALGSSTNDVPGHFPKNIQYVGCIASGGEMCCYSQTGARQVSLSGCIGYGNQEDGLRIFTADNPETGEIAQKHSVTGCIFRENGMNGVRMEGIHSSVISSSIINNNSQTSAGTHGGISIENGSTYATSIYSHHITIENCLITDDQPVKTQKYAVRSLQNSDYIKVFLADVSGNLETNAPLSLVGANNMTGNNEAAP